MRSGSDDLQRESDSGRSDLVRRLKEDLHPETKPGNERGEFCSVERVFIETGKFNFTTGERIESADDVAFIFSALEDAAKEHAFLVLVKNGKPTVVELGMGTFSATLIDTPTASLAFHRIQPDEIYYVHNHPTGNLKCSLPDVQSLEKLQKMTGKPVQGVIINLKTGKYGTFGTAGERVEREKRIPEKEYPLTVHTLDKQIFADDYDPMSQPLVSSSQDVASFLNSHRMGDRAKVSFLILSRAHRIVGNIHTPFTDISKDPDKIARYISENVIQFGGESAILYGDFAIDGTERTDYTKLQDAVKAVGSDLLDIVHVEGNYTRSAKDEGLIFEPGSDYGNEKTDLRFRADEDMSDGERLRAIRALEPIEVEPNDLSREELFSEYRSLPDVIKGGTNIKFLRTMFGKNYKKDGLFAQAVPYLDVILEDSVLAYSEKDSLGGTARPDASVHKKHPNVESFDNYVGKIRLSGKEYYVRLTVQNTKDDTTGVHSCFVSDVELYENPTLTGTDTTIFDRPNLIQNGIIDAKLQQFFERVSSEANKLDMRERVEELAEKLNTPIRVISEESELSEQSEDGKPRFSRRERRAKGWYDPRSGEVTVVLPNNADVEDVAETVLHEVVAHKGLRELIGEENYDSFCDEVYDHLKEDLKQEVDEEATRSFMDEPEQGYEHARRKAVDEMFIRMSEKGFEDFTKAERGIWAKLKEKVLAAINKFLGSLKLPKWVKLGDNELRYMLWRSHERLRGKGDYVDMARDAAKRTDLGLTKEARFRDGETGDIWKDQAVCHRSFIVSHCRGEEA